jgi:hypothetical protein
VALLFLFAQAAVAQPIDRQAVVSRHNVTVDHFDPLSPLSVGNGEFAFTVDPTGLQTFPEAYSATNQTPLCTMAQWGWHTTPMPENLKGQEYRLTQYNVNGRSVGYATSQSGPLATWLRENPHRLDLARIGLVLKKADGTPAKPEDIKKIHQTLDLWTGIITSEFEFEGEPVRVRTCCVGDSDAISVQIDSSLISRGSVAAMVAFPYGSPSVVGADWTKPDRHTTEILHHTARGQENPLNLQRKVDDGEYFVNLFLGEGTEWSQAGKHEFALNSKGNQIAFTCHFATLGPRLEFPADPFAISGNFWRNFWSTGGAIDLSGSTDPRWRELERRIVLSQYLTRVNCAGSLPPAETGLTYNSWYGKFHLEMHWWHDVHFSLWGRQDLFEKAMPYYQKILPAAQQIAKTQGYRGARWPKMTDPSGRDSPSGIGPLLIWQQPHPIYYAELCYRAHPNEATLKQWREIVEQSAEFMASYVYRDPQTGKYVLGPPIKTVPEHNDTNKTRNPTFELSQWRMGLRVAQQWRERMKLPRNPQWDEILNNLSPLPQKDGLYLSEEGLDDTYTQWNWEHPSLIGAYGMLPGDGVDGKIMKPTLEKVMQVWQWDRCWGWDFPMTAMCAARVGRPDLAIDALLIDSVKNKYLPNGHVYQRDNLTLYLPGNGGLLSAVAMMAAGWDGAPPGVNAPGFPREGWQVRWEGLKPMP